MSHLYSVNIDKVSLKLFKDDKVACFSGEAEKGFDSCFTEYNDVVYILKLFNCTISSPIYRQKNKYLD